MGTKAIIGYPKGAGRELVDNWDDADGVRELVGKREIWVLGLSERYDERHFPEDLATIETVRGTCRETRIVYFKVFGDELCYPMGITREEGFFERDWSSVIEYFYLYTADGWFGRAVRWGDGRVKLVRMLIREYEEVFGVSSA